MFGTGDRELGMCSTLPGCDIIDRFEIVLQPSTSVVAPEMMLSAVEEMGPGSRMSPDMIGKESTNGLDDYHFISKQVHDAGLMTYLSFHILCLRGNTN